MKPKKSVTFIPVSPPPCRWMATAWTHRKTSYANMRSFRNLRLPGEYSDEGIKPISDYHFYLISFSTHVII